MNNYVPVMGKVRRIHFVGIGGVGMSGIAEVLHNQGYQVSGSDINESAVVKRLQDLGLVIYLGHNASHVKDVDVVVTSTAVGDDNPERVEAHRLRIPVVPRAVMLAELMRFRKGIAVSGTHGKTTTTSMLSSMLAHANLDPTFVIGGVLNSAGTNAKLGTGEYLVAEADESDASFLYLQPTMAIVTNIDADHMETYQSDFSVLRKAFVNFLHRLPFYGLAVVCYDDPVIKEMIPEVSRPIITYGFSDGSDVQGIDFIQQGLQSSFTVLRQGKKSLKITMNLPGKHNALNAMSVIAIATEIGLSDSDIIQSLASFSGIGRRFQMLGEFSVDNKQIQIVDDYGHHPREVAVTLEAMRATWPEKRLVAVFQPHRYTRTRDLFNDFISVLSTVDELFLLDIYPAGEKPIVGTDGPALFNAISKKVTFPCTFVKRNSALLDIILPSLKDGDLILTQGAGDIGLLSRALVKALEEKEAIIQ